MNIRNGLIWSTFVLLLVIALVTPATKTYGQLIAQENLLSKSNSKLFYNTIDNKSASSGIEHWMIVPWESSVTEEVLYLESWMTLPFWADQETEVEDWMASAWF